MSTEKFPIPKSTNDDYCNDLTSSEKQVLSEEDKKGG